MTDSHLQETAEKLVLFRLQMIAEPNTQTKNLMDQEFSIKFTNYLLESKDPEKGKRIFEATYKRVLKDKKQNILDEKNEVRERSQQAQQEKAEIQKWTRYIKLNPFGPKKAGTFTLTPDGSKILVLDDQGIRRKAYDAVTLQDLNFPSQSLRETLSTISSDGSTLFTSYITGDYRLVDLRTMQELPKPKLNLPKGASLAAHTLSTDGTKLIYFLNIPGVQFNSIKMYDLKNKRHVPLPFIETDAVSRLLLNQDGSKLIVTSGTGKPRFFDLDKKIEIFKGRIPNYDNSRVSLSSDGRQAVVSWVGVEQQIFLDLVHSTSKLVEFPSDCLIAIFIPHTDWVMETMDGKAFIFDPISETKSAEILFPNSLRRELPQLTVSSDGQTVFSVFRHEVKLLNTDFTEHPWNFPSTHPIENFMLTSDGKKLILQTNQGELFVLFRDSVEANSFPEVKVTP